MSGTGTLLDNDIVLKTCAWKLIDRLLAVTAAIGSTSCLVVARYSIRSRLKRWRSLGDLEAASDCFEAHVDLIDWIEPTDAEIDLAADFETHALKLGRELDPGESQLAAIAIMRASRLMVTGDKRAIVALAEVAAGGLDGRVACMEQVLATLCETTGADAVRNGVCSEPGADRTAAVAFSCNGASSDARSALSSYIGHLRTSAPLLADGDVLLTVVLEEDGVGRAQIGD